MAQRAAYPARPIRYLVGYTPGGTADILARLVGQKLAETWGQQVIVENRPGGGTNIADFPAYPAPRELEAGRDEIFKYVLLLGALHIPLVFLMRASPWASTAHAALVVLLGLRFLLDRTPDRLVYLAGYIVGAELLWRMTDANVFWEFGK